MNNICYSTPFMFMANDAEKYGLTEAVLILGIQQLNWVFEAQGEHPFKEKKEYTIENYQNIFYFIKPNDLIKSIKNLVKIGFLKKRITKKNNEEVVEYIYDKISEPKEKVTKKAKKS